MPIYSPPLRDMQFVLHEVLRVGPALAQLPPHAEVDADTMPAKLVQIRCLIMPTHFAE